MENAGADRPGTKQALLVAGIFGLLVYLVVLAAAAWIPLDMAFLELVIPLGAIALGAFVVWWVWAQWRGRAWLKVIATILAAILGLFSADSMTGVVVNVVFGLATAWIAQRAVQPGPTKTAVRAVLIATTATLSAFVMLLFLGLVIWAIAGGYGYRE